MYVKHEIHIYVKDEAKNSLALHLDPGQGTHNQSALTHTLQLNLFQAVVPMHDWDYFKGHLSTDRLFILIGNYNRKC